MCNKRIFLNIYYEELPVSSVAVAGKHLFSEEILGIECFCLPNLSAKGQ